MQRFVVVYHQAEDDLLRYREHRYRVQSYQWSTKK
jgi:hypothetical protein